MDTWIIVGDNEPVMLFRAQDTYFLDVLDYYRSKLLKDGNTEMAEAVSSHIELASEWRSENEVKDPDLVRYPVFTPGDKVVCIAREGFILDSRPVGDDLSHNYSELALVIGEEYTISEYEREYDLEEPVPYVVLEGVEYAHPATNFKLK